MLPEYERRAGSGSGVLRGLCAHSGDTLPSPQHHLRFTSRGILVVVGGLFLLSLFLLAYRLPLGLSIPTTLRDGPGRSRKSNNSDKIPLSPIDEHPDPPKPRPKQRPLPTDMSNPYTVKIEGGSILLSKILPEDELVEVRRRRDEIVKAFQFAYGGYEKQCMGHGELMPVSGKCKNWLADGMGLTLIDSLDTMLIMGLNEEYRRARDYLKGHLSFDLDVAPLLFEMNIRCVGGLLSAYTLTKDTFLLDQVTDLARRLLPAFNTPTGIPRTSVHLRTGASTTASWAGYNAVLADVASLQLEFSYLSTVTNNSLFAEKAMKVYEVLRSHQPAGKLYPVFVNVDNAGLSGPTNIGALGDSFYEYLLKVWLLGGRKDVSLGKWYYETADAILSGNVHAVNSEMSFVGSTGGSSSREMDHLACFTGGMFAVGSTFISDKSEAARHLVAGEALGRGCYEMYRMNPLGLPADVVAVESGSASFRAVQRLYYAQRPEAVESWFYLWRITKDPKYREWGWKFFEAMNNHTKVKYGYSGVHDATVRTAGELHFDDLQQNDVIPIDKFVFNTEAHPFLVTRT